MLGALRVAQRAATLHCNGPVGLGGGLTVLALAIVPEAVAGVVWYGLPPLEFADASRIRVPMLAHWATQDVPFPIASVDPLEQWLRAALA